MGDFAFAELTAHPPTADDATGLATLISQLEESKFARLFRYLIDSDRNVPRSGFDIGKPAVPLGLPDAELCFKFAGSVGSFGHHTAAWIYQIAHAPTFLLGHNFPPDTFFRDHLKRAFINLKQVFPDWQRWPELRPEYLAAFDSAAEGCEHYYLCTNISQSENAIKSFSQLAHTLFSEIMEIPEDRHPEFGMATPELLAEKAQQETKRFIIDLLNTPSSYYLVAREGQISVLPVTQHGEFLASRDGQNLFSTVGVSAAVTSTLLNQNAATLPVLAELENLINNLKVHEQDLQHFFTVHPELLFALDERYCEIRPHICLFDAKRERLEPDFMARIQDSNIWNVIELKLPTVPMTVCGQTIERASAAAARGIAELLMYRDFFSTRTNRNRVTDRFGTAPYEPCLVLVIGRGRPSHKYEWKSVRSGFPKVEIVSYDYLFERARECAYALRAGRK
jgi:hypothetical protein